ncbi:holo-[acyl-carrier-protein] synthase [Candidatus Bathyarchaeota archaeon]|nr:MAG: holo-[acyl-carrier-protein] synthase [Candidatus Bathyarchaeota archaeon]
MWDVGVDIVEIDRFRRIIQSGNRRFYERIFTPREIEYCLSFKDPSRHFASTFAGKEAVYKALNKYLDVKLSEIEILRDDNGAPQVRLKIDGDDFKNRGISPLEVKLSLSHSSSYAIAFAVVRSGGLSADTR